MTPRYHAIPVTHSSTTGEVPKGVRDIDTANSRRQLVPDAGTVVQVLAGFETPDTVLLMLVHDMLEWWQRHFVTRASRTDGGQADDLIAFGAFLVDHELRSLLGEQGAVGAHVPSRTYGQVVARLVRGFVQLQIFRDTPCTDFDPTRLAADIETLDMLATDIREGRT